MSIEAMNWALKQKTGSPAAKSVLLILANRANERGLCFPGIDGIAEQTEISRRSVIRKIQELVAGGFIEIEMRGGDGSGRKSNLYQLRIWAKCQNVTLGQSANSAGQCANRAGQCATVSPEPKEEPKGEPKETPAQPPADLNVKAWADYEKHRKDSRASKLTPNGALLAQKKLAALSHEKQQACVDMSIANGWRGLFPEKVATNAAHKPGTSGFDEVHKRNRKAAGLDPGNESLGSTS